MNFNNIPPITRYLLIINIAVFAMLSLTGRLNEVNYYYGAHYPIMDSFEWYQVITHMFLHGDFGHLLFNMFALWMFGGPIEEYFGRNRYLLLYFLSGLGAFGLQSLSLYFEFPESSQLIVEGERSMVNAAVYNDLMLYTMVGASGCIMGVLAAFAVIYPNTPLMLIFLPIPIKAKYFIAGYIAIELIQGFLRTGNVAHFAHVGGAIIGFILTKIWMKNRYVIHHNN